MRFDAWQILSNQWAGEAPAEPRGWEREACAESQIGTTEPDNGSVVRGRFGVRGCIKVLDTNENLASHKRVKRGIVSR